LIARIKQSSTNHSHPKKLQKKIRLGVSGTDSRTRTSKKGHIMLKKLILSVSCTLPWASHAFSAEYMAASNCQPYQVGGQAAIEAYYQNLGSFLAAKDITVSCPINLPTQPNTIQVRLYYSTQNVNVVQPLRCRINKIAFNQLTNAGQSVYANQGQPYGIMEIINNGSLDGAIGANLDCSLKAGAKILGYYVY
jgi:hypothetical protein